MMNLAEYRRHAQSLADFLPWAALIAKGVVLNKDRQRIHDYSDYFAGAYSNALPKGSE